MRHWKTILCACILIAAVAVICIAPAYSLEPTALRAWNAALDLLAALGTLIVLSLAAPLVPCERLFDKSEWPRAIGAGLLRFSCTLLI